jgi:hypothetical protein
MKKALVNQGLFRCALLVGAGPDRTLAQHQGLAWHSGLSLPFIAVPVVFLLDSIFDLVAPGPTSPWPDAPGAGWV